MHEYSDLLSSIDRIIKAADDELKEQLLNDGLAEPDYTVDEIGVLEEELTTILEKERDHFVGGIQDKEMIDAATVTLQQLKISDTAHESIADLFRQVLTETVTVLTSAYIHGVDDELKVSRFTRRTTDWIESWSKDLGDVMKVSTHEGLDRILTDALAEGKGISEVTVQLMDWYGFSRKRAHATAVTEMLTAHSVAQQESYIQSPVVSQKMWRHTGEHKNEPRPNHVAMDGVIVDVNEPFPLLGAEGTLYHPMFPRDTLLPPSERVHCHCISQPIVSEDVLGLSLEERQRLQEEAILEDDGLWEVELDRENRAKAGI